MSVPENEASYREMVQRLVKSGQLSSEDQDRLNNYRSYLNLLPTQARAIEQDVLSAHPATESERSPQPSSFSSTSSLQSAEPAAAEPTASGSTSASSLQLAEPAAAEPTAIEPTATEPTAAEPTADSGSTAVEEATSCQSISAPSPAAAANLKMAHPILGQTSPDSTSGQTLTAQPGKAGFERIETDPTSQPEVKQSSTEPTSAQPSSAQNATSSASELIGPTAIAPPSSISTTERPTSHSELSPGQSTILPPQQPEIYFAHLEEYGKAFLKAFQTESFNTTEKTRAELQELAKKWNLSGADVGAVQREVLIKYCLTSQPPTTAAAPTAPVPDTLPPATPDIPPIQPSSPPPEENYPPRLEPLFKDLKILLERSDFREGDKVTFTILQALFSPLPWTNPTLRDFSPQELEQRTIQTIDQYWRDHSQQKFGFSRQLKLYGPVADHTVLENRPPEQRMQALHFSRQVSWWMDGLEFFKYYWMLDFTSAAPEAHLPARWFWDLPQQKAICQGGFAKTRGGCRIDDFTLPTFMCVLARCGIQPQ